MKSSPETDALNFAPRIRVLMLMLICRSDYSYPHYTSQLPLFRPE